MDFLASPDECNNSAPLRGTFHNVQKNFGFRLLDFVFLTHRDCVPRALRLVKNNRIFVRHFANTLESVGSQKGVHIIDKSAYFTLCLFSGCALRLPVPNQSLANDLYQGPVA